MTREDNNRLEKQAALDVETERRRRRALRIAALELIDMARDEQERKHPGKTIAETDLFVPRLEKLAITTEELGEVAREVNDLRALERKDTELRIGGGLSEQALFLALQQLEGERSALLQKLRRELAQLGACACGWLESLGGSA